MNTYCVVDTKLGFIALAGHDGKLTHSSLPKASEEEALASLGVASVLLGEEDEKSFGDLPDRLRRYASGECVDFSDVPLDPHAVGPFHIAAVRAAQQIPYGQLVTYRELARMAGNERAARAAGTAMANNTMPIIIPCHRVVASGGKIGGFSSGLEWKRTLLKLEGVAF